MQTTIVVADASITCTEVIQAHLSSATADLSRIYFRRLKESIPNAIDASSFTFLGLPARIINTNSYPASRLHLEWKVYTGREKSTEMADVVRQNILNSLVKEFFEESNSPSVQTLIYIQDKIALFKLVEGIQQQVEESTDSKCTFEHGRDYLLIHSDLTDEGRRAIQSQMNEVRFIFTTASASRGLSFKRVRRILVEVPHFEIERNLMEILQVVYRGRGDRTYEQMDQLLRFYVWESLPPLDESQQPLRRKGCPPIHALCLLVILRAALLTRIKGFAEIGRHNFVVVPVGGKSVASGSGSYTASLSHLLKRLQREARQRPQTVRFQKTVEAMQKMLDHVDAQVGSEHSREWKKLAATSLENFLDLLNQGFDKLSELLLPPDALTLGSLLIGRAESLKETYEISFRQAVVQYATPDILGSLQGIIDDPELPKSVQYEAKDFLDLVYRLRDPVAEGRTQILRQKTTVEARYFCIPLAGVPITKECETYFAGTCEREEHDIFAQIFQGLLRTHCPTESLLPMVPKYRELPFVFFNSTALMYLLGRPFRRQFILTAPEINLIGMLLTASE